MSPDLPRGAAPDSGSRPERGELRSLTKAAGWQISLHSTWCWSCEQHSRLHRRDASDTDTWYCESCEVKWYTPALIYLLTRQLEGAELSTVVVCGGKIRLSVNAALQRRPGHSHAWAHLDRKVFGDSDQEPIRACGRCGKVEPMRGR